MNFISSLLHGEYELLLTGVTYIIGLIVWFIWNRMDSKKYDIIMEFIIITIMGLACIFALLGL